MLLITYFISGLKQQRYVYTMSVTIHIIHSNEFYECILYKFNKTNISQNKYNEQNDTFRTPLIV